MYESPIDIIYGEIQTRMENEICHAVQEVGINVNKDQLISALMYDRNQYEKGYQEGKREVLEKVLKEAKENGWKHEIRGEEYFMGKTEIIVLSYDVLEDIIKGLLN